MAFGGEELPLLPGDLRGERAVGPQHPPPRHVIELMQRADHGARSARTTGSQRDLAIGEHPPARDASHDAPHCAGKRAERGTRGHASSLSFGTSRAHKKDGPLTTEKQRRPGSLVLGDGTHSHRVLGLDSRGQRREVTMKRRPRRRLPRGELRQVGDAEHVLQRRDLLDGLLEPVLTQDFVLALFEPFADPLILLVPE